MLGGNWKVAFYDDVWWSTTGDTWELATDSAGWPARANHSVVVYHDTMWMMAGCAGTQNMNDVWRSADGTNWTQVTAAAAWPVRKGQTVVVLNDTLWLYGGINGLTYYNDVWYSVNGADWTEATGSGAPWSARWNHAALAFDNRMWLFGGWISGGQTLHDVWYSTGFTGLSAAPAAGAREQPVHVSPNPFSTAVSLRLAAKSPAELRIHDSSGRLVRTIRAVGSYVWDGRDQQGRKARPGVYLLSLETEHGLVTTQITKCR